MKKATNLTREEWLNQGAEMLTPLIIEAGGGAFKPPLCSVGFPQGSRGGKNGAKAIGQCWSKTCSEDKKRSHIFLHPELADPVRVLDVLAHELVHASVGVEHGHKKPFRDVAVALGLEGKMTATVAGEKLTERLNTIIKAIGEYPHVKLNTDTAKKKGSRLLKAECPACGCIARITRKWAEQGLRCGCNEDNPEWMEIT